MGLLIRLSAVVSTAFTGVIYVFACLKAWAGAFGVGWEAITALSQGISELISTAGTLRHAFEFLDTPNDMYQGSLTTEKRADCNYKIEFKSVSFKHPGTDDYALKDVSIAFNLGRTWPPASILTKKKPKPAFWRQGMAKGFLALARALYKEAPFIILDEPTAALDPVAEYEFTPGSTSLWGKRQPFTSPTGCQVAVSAII